MDLNLKGRRAIVCGSTRGIGKAIAVELAQLGAGITLIARNEESLNAAIQELFTEAGQRHEYVVADFSFPEKLRSAIGSYVAQTDVHILVNNTGGPPGGPAIEAKAEDFINAF